MPLVDEIIQGFEGYKPYVDLMVDTYDFVASLAPGGFKEIPGWVRNGVDVLDYSIKVEKSMGAGNPILVSIIVEGVVILSGNVTGGAAAMLQTAAGIEMLLEPGATFLGIGILATVPLTYYKVSNYAEDRTREMLTDLLDKYGYNPEQAHQFLSSPTDIFDFQPKYPQIVFKTTSPNRTPFDVIMNLNAADYNLPGNGMVLVEDLNGTVLSKGMVFLGDLPMVQKAISENGVTFNGTPSYETRNLGTTASPRMVTIVDGNATVIGNDGTIVPLQDLSNMMTSMTRGIGKFFSEYLETIQNFYDKPEGTLALQGALAQVIVRLVQGEDFNVVMTQITGQLLLAPEVNDLFHKLFEGSTILSGQTGAVVQSALSSFVLQSIMNGGQDMAQVAAMATVQAAVQQGLMTNTFFTQTHHVYENGIWEATDALELSPAGAGAMAAAMSLFSSLLNGGINAKAIEQAAIAGGVGYASAAIAGMIAGPGTWLGTFGIAAGPMGIVVGAALGFLTSRLFGGATQYIHGETVSHVTQVQADGSLLLIGVREAGSLLRTTGTTNDDYVGNDSADNTSGHDVIVGQAGMNEIYARGGHDFMEGRAAADYIDAGNGDDQAEAGDGDDFVNGGNGNDRIYGGNGDDILLGDNTNESGNDVVLGGAGNDRIEGGAGTDELYGGTGNDQILGGTGDDVLDGGAGDDILLGEAGNDEIDGGDGNDTVQGNDGNDVIAGGAGNDNLEGNAGDDVLAGESGVDVLYGHDGNDTLNGGLENDLAFGGLGKDTLIGGYGDDDLYGELGDDLLAGNAGDDLLAGGADNDVYLYASGDGHDVIEDAEGTNVLKLRDLNVAALTGIARVGDDLKFSFGTTGSVTVKDHFIASGLSKVEFANGQGIDVAALTFDGSGVGTYASLLSGQNVLAGYGIQLAHHDVSVAFFNASTALTTSWLTDNYDTSVTTSTVDKEIYNDVQVRSWSKGGFFKRKKVFFYDYHESVLTGSGGADRIVGMWWDETINGAGNNDQLYGNVGNDTVDGGTDHDIIFGGAGTDILQGGNGNDEVFGGSGNDTIGGSDGNDTLYGDAGDDTLNADIGDDYLSGDEGNDTLNGGTGRDLLYGGEGNDTLNGNDDDDYLNGGNGANTLDGGNGNDILFGGSGNDSLLGGAGDDILLGGGGTDTADGGDGNDTLVLSGRIADYNLGLGLNGLATLADNRVGAPDGSISFSNVEVLKFNDQDLTLDGLFPGARDLTLPQGKTFNGFVDLPAGYTVALLQGPVQGTLTLNANGTYAYTAPASYVGQTNFTYRMTSPQGFTKDLQVNVKIAPPSNGSGVYTPTANDTARTSFTAESYGANWDIKYRYRTGVVRLLDGAYVSVWSTVNSDGTGANVYYDVRSKTGSVIKGLARGNATTSGNQNNVTVTNLADGGFVLGWTDWNNGGSAYWRRFNASGNAVTGDIRAVPPTGWNGVYVDLVQLADGNLAVVTQGRPDAGDYQVYMVRFDLAGTMLDAAPVLVNTGGTTSTQTQPRIIVMTNGNAVVAWEDWGGTDGSGYGVFAQIMSPAGVKVGSQIKLNTTVSGTQQSPYIAALTGGGFVAAWSSNHEGNGYGIFAQRFSETGVRVGAEFLVNSYSLSDQIDPSVTALADGGFLVSWSSAGQDGSGQGLYTRRFDRDGTALGAETQINTTTTNDQMLVTGTELTNNDVIFAWQNWSTGSPQAMLRRFTGDSDYIFVTGADTSESLVGNTTNDILTGKGGDDVFDGLGGNDLIDGGDGTDTAQYSGNLSNYTVTVNDGVVSVVDGRVGTPDGTDTLTTVERLKFADQTIDLTSLFPQVFDIIVPDGATYNGQLQVPAGYTVTLVQGPGAGTGTVTLAADGSYTYVAPDGYSGTTEFKFRLTAPNGVAQIAPVNVRVSLDGIGSGTYTDGTEQTVTAFVTEAYGANWDIKYRYRNQITRLTGGGYVVAWSAVDGDGSGANVYYQAFNAAGAAVGAPAKANTTSTGGNQNFVTVTTLADGGFVVGWSDWSGNSSAYWRRFDAAGAAQTGENRMMPPSTGWNGQYEYVAQFPDGTLAVFSMGRHDSGDYQVYMRRYNLDGTAIDAVPVQVNTPASGTQTLPRAVTLTNGNVVVMWEDQGGNDSSGNGIYYQVLASDGSPVGNYGRANTTTSGGQVSGDIAALSGSGFVVVWSSPQDTSGYGVYAQRFLADGSKSGSEFLVNTYVTSDQLDAAVTALSDGGFFVTWQSNGQDGSGQGIYGKRFNSSGTAVGTEVQISDTVTGDQMLPDVSELANRDLMFTWQSWATGGAELVQKRLVAPSGTGAYSLSGSAGSDILLGGSLADVLSAGDGDDLLIGGGGNDTITGGNGVDTVQYSGPRSNYSIYYTNSTLTVNSTAEGKDTVSAEILKFSDQTIDLRGMFPDIKSLVLAKGTAYTGKLVVPAGYTAFKLSNPASGTGTVTVSADGTFTYTPPADYVGNTSFQYRITAPNGVKQEATMSVKVLPRAIGPDPYTPVTEVSLGAVSTELQGTSSPNWDTRFRDRNQVSKLIGGGYVSVWSNMDTDGTGANVYYQVFAADGTAVTSAARVNTTTGGNQQMAMATSLSDGGFAVAWTDWSNGGMVYWRRYNSSGVAQTAEISGLPANTAWNGLYGNIVQLTGGTLAMLSQARSDAGDYNIYLTRFSTSGTMSGTPTFVNYNASTTGTQTLPRVAAMTNGNMIVVWDDWGGADGSGYGVYGKRLDANGASVGSIFRINTTTSGNQHFADVAALGGGGFVVVWSSSHEGSSYGIYGQRYDASAVKVGSEFLINGTTSGEQNDAAVTALSDGGFFVTWMSDGQDGSAQGVYGKRYDQNGNTLGTEIRLNDTTTNTQWMPDITELTSGDLVASWQSWQSGTPQVIQKRFTAPTSDTGYTYNGGTGNEILSGKGLDDVLIGNAGNDVFLGGAGNDTLRGGAGNDVYRFGIGQGADIVDNQDSAGTDKVAFDAGVGRQNVWFQQSGYDLKMSLLNHTDTMTFQNWFVSDAQKVDQFVLSDGYVLDKAQVDQLVGAMAGFNPQAIGSVSAVTDLPQGVQNTIAATWHT